MRSSVWLAKLGSFYISPSNSEQQKQSTVSQIRVKPTCEMVGLFRFCPCFGSHGYEPDRDSVLLVSGLGGSILHSKSKRKTFFGFEIGVCVRILFADTGFKRRLWSLYNPSTGLSLSLSRIGWIRIAILCWMEVILGSCWLFCLHESDNVKWVQFCIWDFGCD